MRKIEKILLKSRIYYIICKYESIFGFREDKMSSLTEDVLNEICKKYDISPKKEHKDKTIDQLWEEKYQYEDYTNNPKLILQNFYNDIKDNPVPQITEQEIILILAALDNLPNKTNFALELMLKFSKLDLNKGVEANKELPKKKKSLVRKLEDLETNFEYAAYTNGDHEMLNRKIKLLAEYLDSLGR